MKKCPFCRSDGVKKILYGASNSTEAEMETGTAATCSNRECEINSHIFSIETWENRIEVKL